MSVWSSFAHTHHMKYCTSVTCSTNRR